MRRTICRPSPSSSTSLGTNGCPERSSTTGCRDAARRTRCPATSCGRQYERRRARSAKPASTSAAAIARAVAASAPACPAARSSSSAKSDFSRSSASPSAPRMRRSRSGSSAVTKRSAPVRVCLRVHAVRHAVEVGARDLEGVAEHPVVADLEVGDAGGGALPRLQLAQDLLAVAGQPPRLVELRVAARAGSCPGPSRAGTSSASVASRSALRSSRGSTCAARAASSWQGEEASSARSSGSRARAGAKTGQLAGSQLLEAQTGRHALQVPHAGQPFPQASERRRLLDQPRHRLVAERGRRRVARAAAAATPAAAALPSA